MVITRHARQRVFLDVPGRPRIVVEVIEVSGDKVRLGLHADRDVVILREELDRPGEARPDGERR